MLSTGRVSITGIQNLLFLGQTFLKWARYGARSVLCYLITSLSLSL